MFRIATSFVLFAGLVMASGNALAAPSEKGATSEIGELAGASYRIDIPADWNRELIVFYHGYEPEPGRFEKRETLSPMFDPLLDRGYAVLQSGYSAGGWAIEQGYADTETLRQKFVHDHGKPKRSFVMGMSMGGTLTVMTIEQRPQIYAGALSLCGVLEATDSFLQHSELIYTGSRDDEALNDGVKRYRADPKARAYALRWYTPSGDLKRPMLALHDVGDPLVIASTAFEYAMLAQRKRNGANFTQQYVNRSGHCVFEPTEIANAFDQLVNWVDSGHKPPSGVLPAAVAK